MTALEIARLHLRAIELAREAIRAELDRRAATREAPSRIGEREPARD